MRRQDEVTYRLPLGYPPLCKISVCYGGSGINQHVVSVQAVHLHHGRPNYDCDVEARCIWNDELELG